MPNDALSGRGKLNSDDVEAAGRFDQFGVFRQVAEGDFSDLSALGCRDRFLGTAVLGIGPGFDLAKDQSRTIPGDDIDFSSSETIAADDEAEFFPEKVVDGGFFASAA